MENLTSKEEAQKRLGQMQRAVHRMKIMYQCGYYIAQYNDEEWNIFLEGDLWKPYYSSLNYSDILEEYILKEDNNLYGGQNHTMRLVAVVDQVRKHYLLLTVGYDSDGSDAHGVVYHLSIKEDKVIVYANNSDTLFKEELEDLGIDPNDIIRG